MQNQKSYWSVKVRIKREKFQPFEIEGLTLAKDPVESAELAKNEVHKMLQNLPNFGGAYHLTMTQNKRLTVSFIAGVDSEAKQEAEKEILDEVKDANVVEPIVATEPAPKTENEEPIVATEPKPVKKTRKKQAE